MTQKAALSDIVLILSIGLLVGDLACEWDEFKECPKPIHVWLFVSYLLLVVSRVIVVGAMLMSSTEAGCFLLNLRQKSATLQMLLSFTWLVVVPLFTLWSFYGTLWTYEVLSKAPDCMPSVMHTWFLVIWQAMSYAWVIIYGGLGAVAWVLELRLRKAEGDLRQLEDSEMVSRWGRIGDLESYAALHQKMAREGLSSEQIQALGGARTYRRQAVADCNDDEDCSICLNAFRDGDSIRQLGSCKHVFHRSCVDLWLLRSAECPLCKVQVSS